MTVHSIRSRPQENLPFPLTPRPVSKQVLVRTDLPELTTFSPTVVESETVFLGFKLHSLHFEVSNFNVNTCILFVEASWYVTPLFKRRENMIPCVLEKVLENRVLHSTDILGNLKAKTGYTWSMHQDLVPFRKTGEFLELLWPLWETT